MEKIKYSGFYVFEQMKQTLQLAYVSCEFAVR